MSFALTIPARPPTITAPTDLSEVIHWYDASQQVGSGDVTAINDRVGTLHFAYTGSGVHAQTGATTVNGQNCITSVDSGSTCPMMKTGTVAVTPPQSEFYLIGSLDLSTRTSNNFLAYGTGSLAFSQSSILSSGWENLMSTPGVGSGYLGTTDTISGLHVFRFALDGATGAVNYEVDGVTLGSGTNFAGFSANSLISLWNNNISFVCGSNKFCELVVTNTWLSGDKKRKLYDYFRRKWGTVGVPAVMPAPLLTQPNPASCPVDIITNAGFTCVVAHSVTRKLKASYNGPAFQITRDDMQTLDVGFNANGVVDPGSYAEFTRGRTCKYSILYDQTGTLNHLPQTDYNRMALIGTLKIKDRYCPIMRVNGLGTSTQQQFYRNRTGTHSMPVNDDNISMYYVRTTEDNGYYTGDWGTYEIPVMVVAYGHDFSLGYATNGSNNALIPQYGIDLEVVLLTVADSTNPPIANFMAKQIHSNNFVVMKLANATSGSYTTLHNQVPLSGAVTHMEGGLSMGEGGDGSVAVSRFLEGVIVAGATDDATDNLLQANVAAFYGS